MVRWLLVVIFAAILLGVAVQHSRSKEQEEQKTRAQAKAYFLALTDSGEHISQTMTSLPGPEGLDYLKRVISAYQFIEDKAYDRYAEVRSGSGGTVAKSVDIADDIDYVHREFQKSTREFLAYWDDKKPAHISEGGEDLKQCLQEANLTVKKLNGGQ